MKEKQINIYEKQYLAAVYGTLRQGEGNHGVIQNSEYIGEETIKGWKMYDIGYFPGILPDEEGEIVVELYKVDEDTKYRLDRLEGFYGFKDPRNMYNIETVQTSQGEALIYVWNGGELDKEIKSGNWLIR